MFNSRLNSNYLSVNPNFQQNFQAKNYKQYGFTEKEIN